MTLKPSYLTMPRSISILTLGEFTLLFQDSSFSSSAPAQSWSTTVEDETISIASSNNFNHSPMLNMTICKGRCFGDCREYLLPTNACYNPQTLFPNDPSWGQYDVIDEILDSSESDPITTFRRTIYPSTNLTCTIDGEDPTDVFTIPLNECVGPFGKPRPWGTFQLVQEGKDAYSYSYREGKVTEG